MLQIFTYSTGLALTGRSAACAPATATRPAAEPRRRLFTIFIVTSKFVDRGRVPLFGCRRFHERRRSICGERERNGTRSVRLHNRRWLTRVLANFREHLKSAF